MLLLDRKKFEKALLATSGLRFLYPLDEDTGSAARDISGNGLHGTYDGPTLRQAGYNSRIPISASFDGLNDVITLPAGCSVRGLGTFTLVAVTNVTNSAASGKYIYAESVSDVAASNRFSFDYRDTEALNCFARSKKSSQTISTKTSSTTGLTGWRIVHVSVNITTNAITMYNNGSALDTSGTVDFGGDTIIEDTAPSFGPVIGRYGGASPLWYIGKFAFVGMWDKVLSTDEIAMHARAGGFA